MTKARVAIGKFWETMKNKGNKGNKGNKEKNNAN